MDGVGAAIPNGIVRIPGRKTTKLRNATAPTLPKFPATSVCRAEVDYPSRFTALYQNLCQRTKRPTLSRKTLTVDRSDPATQLNRLPAPSSRELSAILDNYSVVRTVLLRRRPFGRHIDSFILEALSGSAALSCYTVPQRRGPNREG
ncbi:hypothetical protein E4U58_003550 [Claviceps cyperi]|nr:hypothetical protein E4U58_003550 [Claviceps cyperi]